MIGSVSTSRRAHALAQALDEHDREVGEETADGDHEQSVLLAVADGLDALPKPDLDPEVKTVQRAQLIAAMEAAFAEGSLGEGAAGRGDGRPVPEQRGGARTGRGAHRAPPLSAMARLRPKTRLGKGLAAGGLSVGVAATAFGGAAAASSDALPGDTLYGLKRGMEGIQLDLAGDDADRGKVYLDHASTRLREARRLVERGRSGDLDHESVQEVRRALSGMQHDASEGHRLLSAAYERDGKIGTMQSLSSFSKEHRLRWAQLRDLLPGQLSDVGERVSSVFDAIEQEVGPLRSLFPPSPDDAAPAEKDPGIEGRSTEDDAPPRPTPSSSTDPADGTGEDSGTPTPSGSGSESADDGLLGGKGLFDPSGRPDGRRSGADTDPGSETPKQPAPEITLPPLVPEVLPGLGGDGKGGDK
ncbi:hypothetical protein DVA86_11025 [Streptomyces armeniacus]|uniref:DUF5667 domain-containing protein n=1 Tax=Streptomyces armeniacus TaxID=83291 RepID=A0A345XN89_9ACTN|nr:DUF5667 domain-containing protein [Streptomyces armeniacus]AXK33105.1 hypothetical protein DVA86_11025 [Streptomyces armeniacus]